MLSRKSSCIGCAPGQNADGSKAHDHSRPGDPSSMNKKDRGTKGGGDRKGGGKAKD